MRRFQVLMMIFLLTVLLAGCAGMPMGPTADPTNPIKRLAMLPIQNDTTDVEAPAFVREKLAAALQKRFYTVQPLEETDRILRDQLGITLGGQLGMATVDQLREALQVEGLLYGTLMDFGETTTGLVNVRKVRGKFRIVETGNESVFWENGIGVKSQDTSGGVLGSLSGAVANAGGSDEEVPWVVIENTSSNNSALEGLAAGLTKKTDFKSDFKSSGRASGPGNRRDDLAVVTESAMGCRGCYWCYVDCSTCGAGHGHAQNSDATATCYRAHELW